MKQSARFLCLEATANRNDDAANLNYEEYDVHFRASTVLHVQTQNVRRVMAVHHESRAFALSAFPDVFYVEGSASKAPSVVYYNRLRDIVFIGTRGVDYIPGFETKKVSKESLRRAALIFQRVTRLSCELNNASSISLARDILRSFKDVDTYFPTQDHVGIENIAYDLAPIKRWVAGGNRVHPRLFNVRGVWPGTPNPRAMSQSFAACWLDRGVAARQPDAQQILQTASLSQLRQVVADQLKMPSIKVEKVFIAGGLRTLRTYWPDPYALDVVLDDVESRRLLDEDLSLY